MTGLRPAVIAISGPIGSGKTTIAGMLSRHTRWPTASYGDVVRAIAKRDGLTQDREQLQLTGARLITEGWTTFTRSVLSQAQWKPGDPVIVEGIRHAEAVAALKQLTEPLPVVVIYLNLAPDTGLARARARDQAVIAASRHDATHPTETDIPRVRAMADLIVPVADRTPEMITTDIIRHLGASSRPAGADRA